MDQPKLQPPGSYLRLIAAGSKGIGGRPVPMDEIALSAAEQQGIEHVVAHHWANNCDDLSIEQRIQWGALVLFLIARSPDTMTPQLPFTEAVTVEQLDAIRRGVELVERLEVPGARQVFQKFHAAVENAGGPREASHRRATTEPPYAIEAETLRPVLGRHRIRVRVTSTSESPVGADTACLRLVLPSRTNIAPCIDDAPGATIVNDDVEIPIGEDWAEILFRLLGPHEEEVAVGIRLRDATGAAETFQLEERFSVIALPIEIPAARGNTNYTEAVRRAREYLCVHGSISEIEIRRLCASVNAFRRFLLEAEDHFRGLPFEVRSELAAGRKRWVKKE